MRHSITKKNYGMMIAIIHDAYLDITSKRAAWVLGIRGISSDFSNKKSVKNTVYLCNIYTGKTNAKLIEAKSLMHFSDTKIMTKIKFSYILLPVILILLLTNCHESFAQQQFIRLAWSPNSEPHLSHYKLYRDTKSGTMVYLATIDKSDTIYSDSQIASGNTYYYKLTAVDDQGFESTPSNEVMAITKAIPGDDNENGTVLEQFELKQNYPNPFNPSTTIEYQVPEYTNVTITVYSVLGKEVRVVLNEYKEAGNYQVEWDGRDNEGLRVSSGLYFYQMTTVNYQAVKKLMVQK